MGSLTRTVLGADRAADEKSEGAATLPLSLQGNGAGLVLSLAIHDWPPLRTIA